MPKKPWMHLLPCLQRFPWDWDGKASILELKDADYQWRQMEWIGWYFEHLCRHRLQHYMKMPGPRVGNVEFDGFLHIPWDFKAHVIQNRKGKAQRSVILNDKLAVDSVIAQYGALGVVVAQGLAEFNDHDRSFWLWHSGLKGGKSAYEERREARGAPSRVRKVALEIQSFDLYCLSAEDVDPLGIHAQGRNSDGSPRALKYRLHLDAVDPVASVRRPPDLPSMFS